MQESNSVANAKAGDKVKCIDNYWAEQHFTSEGIYTITKVYPDGIHVNLEHTGTCMWHLDRFELIKEEPMKFNPVPGDKIICNNGEEFICCTLETLISEDFNPYFENKSKSAVFGKKGDYSEWMYWYNEGYPNDPEWNIREVIPQNTETPADKNEEVKEEPQYTMQEIREAWVTSGWGSSTISWSTFQKNLIKNDDAFQEYLRLKAIYE